LANVSIYLLLENAECSKIARLVPEVVEENGSSSIKENWRREKIRVALSFP